MSTQSVRARGVVIDRSGGRPWLTPAGDSVIPGDEWDLTILVDVRPGYVPRDVEIVEIGNFTDASIHAAVADLAAQGPLNRISTTSEHFLQTVATLREQYAITGNGVQYTARLRDKWLMKQCALRHQIRTLDGTRADQLDPWLEHTTSDGGYVLKPRDESGSAGVNLVPEKDTLRRAVESLSDPSAYLVEVCSQHPILHVDVVVSNGRAIYQVSQYERPCHVSGRSTPLSSFTIDDPTLLADVDETVDKILAAWEVDNDVLHIELFAEPSGVVLLELAGRPGAAGVPEVFAHTRGIDLLHAKTRLDFGIDPLPFATPPPARHAGWTVIYAPTEDPAVVDDHTVSGHATRSVLDPHARRIDGVAGLGVATYSFMASSVPEVRAMIGTYERDVRVRALPAHDSDAGS